MSIFIKFILLIIKFKLIVKKLLNLLKFLGTLIFL